MRNRQDGLPRKAASRVSIRARASHSAADEPDTMHVSDPGLTNYSRRPVS